MIATQEESYDQSEGDLADDDVASAEAGSQRPGPTAPSRLRVLVVDERPLVRTGVSGLVRGAGIGRFEAYLAATPLITVSTFLANRYWTFSDRAG